MITKKANIFNQIKMSFEKWYQTQERSLEKLFSTSQIVFIKTLLEYSWVVGQSEKQTKI